MKLKVTMSVLLMVAVALPVYTQRVGETVHVTVVEVPVTVIDRDGNAVAGLTADNFELYDDGKKVPIDYFEVLDLRPSAQATAKADDPLPPAASRNFLLLFDLANSSPGTIERASVAAKEFVATQLGPRDLAAVATFTAEAGARMVTNFTRDKALLTKAVETLGHPKYFKAADPLMITAVTPAPTGEITDGGGVGVGSAAMEAEITKMIEDLNRVTKKVNDGEARNRIRIQFTNLARVARVLDRMRGQKQIILLSEGFDASLVQGRENIGAEATKEGDRIMAGEVWNVDSDQKFGNATATNDVREMGELFRRSDVTMHAIDIKGLRGTSDVTSGAPTKGKSVEGLHMITAPTGGSVFKNNNDMSQTFDKLMKQQEVVYLLGFQARTSGKPGKFHTLKVKAANPRGARVAHRPGYYEHTVRMTDLERTLTLAEIMMTDAAIDDVTLNLGSTTLPGPGGRARIPVVVEIPSSGLLKELQGTKANAQLLLYAFNESGQVIDHLQERIGLDLATAGDAVKKNGVRYYGSLRMPPGKYAVKALVRVEETGLIGFRRQDIEVPAFDTATIMRPVVFEDPGQWAMVLGPARGDDFAYPFAAGEAKYIPKSEPVIAANGEYKVALFLYRVPIENLSVGSTLVLADGSSQPANVSLLGRTSADERGSVKLLFNFKPQTIAAGRHELRFDVKTKDGTSTAVTLPFVVQ